MRLLVVLIFLYIYSSTLAQQNPPSPDVQQILDDIIGTQDLETVDDQLYENLLLILSDPININKATEERLRFLGFLSEYQINNLLEYRNTNGDLISIYELQAIPGFDQATIDRLVHFVIVEDPAATLNSAVLRRILSNKNNYFLFRYEQLLEEKKGFRNDIDPDKKFKGSPEEIYFRYRNSRPGDFSVGLTLEKDAGESFQWEPMKQVGFDFFSFHAQLMNKGKLKNIIVGDYQVQAGQGLVLGGLFGIGKGGETITSARRSNLGGIPYTSTYENGNLRGLLATYQLNKYIYATGFVSKTKRDASIDLDEFENNAISALQTSGLHRNNTELAGKDRIDENNVGGILTFKNHQLDAGLIWNTVDFGDTFKRNPTPYNQFALRSRVNHNAAAYLNYNYKNFTFFSEFAKSLNGGAAFVGGLLGSMTPRLDITFLYRNYQRNFHPVYSNAFGENSTTQNETGVYWGWKYKWNKKYSLAGYVDWFRFPWLRYRSYAPSEGHEWLVRFNYNINRNTLLYFQIREENKSRNVSDEKATLYLTDVGIKRNYLFSVQIGASKSLKLRSRIQGSSFNFNKTRTTGFAIIQDVIWTKGRLSLTGRYALFDTDDYDNRQYVYENDVWLAFSIPAYSGKGVRNYILAQYKFNKHISVWARYAHVRFTDRETIGSGYDVTEGNQRNDIKLQIKIAL